MSKVPDSAWKKIKADARKIIKQAKEDGIQLCYEYDEPNRAPTVCDEYIWFNGPGELGHETFVLPKEMEAGSSGEGYRFNFCKTARKPYDAAVGAILLSLDHHAPEVWSLGSDGGWDEEEWQTAAALYKEATGREAVKPDWLG